MRKETGRLLRLTAAACVALVPCLVAPAIHADDRGAAKKVTVTLTEGTNMAAVPSPDGTRMVLAIQGALWMVPASGGTATRLTAPEIEATWPVWSPDGTRIAFQNYSDSNYHIWTILADGSQPTQVTSGPYDHREPAWSPDGAKIAFSSDRSGFAGVSYDIWTIDLLTGAYERRTSLATNEHSPAWSPDGSRIAYVDGRVIYAIDAAGARTQLAASPSGSSQAPAWTRDGQGVVFQNNARQLVLGGQAVTSGEDVFPFPVRWLPDGSFVYTADGKIRVRNGDGSNSRDIPFSADFDLYRPIMKSKDHGFGNYGPRPVKGIYAPMLSPDNRKVAFIALNDLWVMEIGRKPQRLTNDTFADWDPSWSPDGRSLYWSSDRHGGGTPDLYRIDLSTRQMTRVSMTGKALNTPTLSPDGKSFAYINYADQAVWVYDLASNQQRRVAPQAYTSNVSRPSWSPDGRTIATAENRRVNTRYREGYNLIRTVDVASGAWQFHEVAPLPNNLSERFEAGPAWSPDGKWMAFIMNSTLHVIPVGETGAPTGPAQQLTNHSAEMPSWGGDSRTIVYMSNGKLMSIQLGGGSAREIEVDLKYRQAAPKGRTIIHAGGLWDGINPFIRQNVDIEIVGNRIRSVRPHRERPKGWKQAHDERFIDASHLTVMPGIWDTHVHPRMRDYTGQWWALQLAFGVTSVTSNGTSPYTTMNQREALDSGTLVGPRLFTGTFFDGTRTYYGNLRSVKDAQVMELELGKARALDIDYLKAYVRAPAPLMQQMSRVAQEMGVPSGSHFLSPGIAAGLGGTTHLSATERMGYGWSESPAGRSYQDVIALFTKGDFHLTSTHSGGAILGDDPGLLDDPRFVFLTPPTYINGLRDDISSPPSESQRERMREAVVTPAEILRAGGVVALGTDSPLSSPALDLHAGLRAFALGVSNHEALQSVTINAARFTRADHELGTIEPGKFADLIMLRSNPLENVANVADIEMVMKNGLTWTIPQILQPYVTTAALTERSRIVAQRARQCRADPAGCVRVAGERHTHGHGHDAGQ